VGVKLQKRVLGRDLRKGSPKKAKEGIPKKGFRKGSTKVFQKGFSKRGPERDWKKGV